MPGHPYRRSGDASLRRAQRLWLAPALVVAGIATAAQVHAITFIEGADFPGSSGPTNPSVGTLGLGTNTVSGMLVGNCVPGDCNGPSAGDTQDSFILQIAAGQEATGVFM
ncbi:MAG: hypothetical protein HKO62_01135, partial [Gammaproteobacteria bacterium]|nr:hypothetical protein [Gammaproteobacteria bacterium]